MIFNLICLFIAVSPALSSVLKEEIHSCSKNQFPCRDGTCIPAEGKCDGVSGCPDGSDETRALCTTTHLWPSSLNHSSGSCVLPAYPEHGSYLTDIADWKLGDAFDAVTLKIICKTGYSVVGPNLIYCLNGRWNETTTPKCVKLCKLQLHPSVAYKCLVTGDVISYRACNEFEPHGTIVSPQCRSPNYYSPTSLPHMRCIQGNWDYIARCNLEIPWHAGIYTKTTTSYTQICGGSLIRNTIVLSAAHCFWSDVDKALPATDFAVAVGKIYRPWNDKNEEPQKSDVKEIKLPTRFQGAATNYQDDIAIVIVTTAFEYKLHVRPVCVDFDVNFERQQLQPGNIGKVVSWGVTAENGKDSAVLKVFDMPYIAIDTCIKESPAEFREYITSDKICTQYIDSGCALCKGGSGGGLVFPESYRGIEQYYLRGILSTAPNNQNLGNTTMAKIFTFTQLTKHEHFIKEYLSDFSNCLI